ncbi:hypothetical protein [Cellulomonas marina]|uniref:Uncharacterized protein n=1 Tax=Cellulomonas marina TaxID=988821 RepID=A0A1I0ZAB1_9CELL|nr:hypothetical protein [Cellulomonas marina]SFB22699.1 hypothetical protein SAMN05421867_11089 [Cellulomonas marina]
MAFFRRRDRVRADLVEGFAVTEAVALQTALVGALRPAERASGAAVPAELVLEAGLDGRVVVVWRNAVVGFVPPARERELAVRVAGAGRALLTVAGAVHRDGPSGPWRVWAGPVPPAGFPRPAPDEDRLAPPPRRVLGIPLTDGP